MGAGGRSPRAPQHRPTWLIFVAAIMLLSAMRLGLTGLLAFTDGGAPPAVTPALVVSAEDAAARTVALASARVVAQHPDLLRVQAAAQIAFALLLLYVVACALTLDARGRRLALLSAWVGIAYHLANMALGLAVLRPAILEVAPGVVSQLVQDAPNNPTVARLLPTLGALSIALPIMAAALGMLFSFMVMVFFGGRRGRLLYGLEPASDKGASV